jgi:lipopolysaccharide export system permease protein
MQAIKKFPQKIDRYLIKVFLTKFYQILLGFSLLTFFINLLDVFEKSKDSGASVFIIVLIAALKIPDFISDVIISLVLISSTIAIFSLSSRNEITIIRSSGFSLWRVMLPFFICSFMLGILWITCFETTSIYLNKKLTYLEKKYINNDTREYFSSEDGIWLKQTDKSSDKEILIQAKKIYRENVELNEVTVWFFDENGKFYQKLDAKQMFLQKQNWVLRNVTLNDAKSINKQIEDLTIPATLDAEFVIQKIANDFQNPKLFSIFTLPKLIENMKTSGFDPTKFKIYFQSLICMPFLFSSMVLISCFFGLNHSRNKNSVLMLFLGITTGLVLYIFSAVIKVLGSSAIISIFSSTWMIVICYLSAGIILTYKKDHL